MAEIEKQQERKMDVKIFGLRKKAEKAKKKMKKERRKESRRKTRKAEEESQR